MAACPTTLTGAQPHHPRSRRDVKALPALCSGDLRARARFVSPPAFAVVFKLGKMGLLKHGERAGAACAAPQLPVPLVPRLHLQKGGGSPALHTPLRDGRRDGSKRTEGRGASQRAGWRLWEEMTISL